MTAAKAGGTIGKPLRVLHVYLYFHPDFSGEGLYLEKLAPLLADLGIRSDVAVAASTSAPMRKPVMPGIDDVHRFVARGDILPWYNGHLVAWFLTHAWRYDVVHFHCFVDRLFLLHMIARISGCRIVQSATLDDGLGMVVDGYRARGHWLVRRLCRLIHHAVAISPRLFEDSLRVLPQRRVSLIPQGVVRPSLSARLGQRAVVRAALGFAPDDIVLLFVGGICVRKDVAFLLDAMPAAMRRNARVRLLLVGPDLDGEYADLIRRRAASLGDGVVRFTGFLEDPSPAYLAADIFVFASRAEGFGNVLIEAMAAGLPVLARRLTGVTDSFIVHGATGFLFSDAASYDEILARLIAEAALRARIGEAARAATADYDMTAAAARYAEVYHNKMAAPMGGPDVAPASDRPTQVLSGVSEPVGDRAR